MDKPVVKEPATDPLWYKDAIIYETHVKAFFDSNRDGIGVKVKLTSGGKMQMKEVTGGGSYLSSSDRRLHFGLGKNEEAERIENAALQE